ncbi:DUF6952 family protein [Solitalea koreensis]|uniref:Uncharacterized protein n=1 Tax=Solitalea koreensis TaxID=543615 RepID=A0A521ELN7_9SPHI|nr:hypothetical protein [Solitalea koreensis]SMO84828.1 hypothetical protein SAMN06265350_11714 [Solitalea koreensis]
MKVPAIKKLVENYDLVSLGLAEEAIMEEKTPAIEIEGEDEGEQLTHVLAAIWIKGEMEKNNIEFIPALRNYTSRVRTSIS